MISRALNPEATMGDDAPANAALSPQGGAPPPPAYNPPAMNPPALDGQNSALGNSVVRDLMRVYESLTQSSTPQVAADDGANQGQPAPGYEQPPTGSHPYTAGQHGNAPNYPIPPASYHMTGQTQYAPSQQQHAMPHLGAPQQPYPAYSQHPYMMTQGEHAPQHGYPIPGGDQVQPMEEQEEDSQDVDSSQEARGSSRRKRKEADSVSSGGRGAKNRKKSKSADGRWSKRFTWPEDLHRDFVSAIFDVGLKHSSPSTILEHMPKHEQITTERIKSHLQKYRLHRVKSKKEFVSSYETSLRNFQNHGLSGANPISGGGVGGVAAHLTYTDMNRNNKGEEGVTAAELVKSEAPASAPTPAAAARSAATEALMLPQLTEAEKSSPIGAAMGYLMGLFFSLKQQLMVQRAMASAESKNQGNAPVKDVFDSFVIGSAPGAARPAGEEIQRAPGQKGVARNNNEENSLMRRDMQNQMALQKQMRALKQQELNKYKNISLENKESGNPVTQADPEEAATIHSQGAGEAQGHDMSAASAARPRTLSLGASDEFWNTDVVDEQLFEFLMNN